MKYFVTLFIFLGCLTFSEAITRYVAPSGQHIVPYTNWYQAATSIQAACDGAIDGDTVLVTGGTYVLSQQIDITNAITVRGFSGIATTIVDGGNMTRSFQVAHTGAVVEAFTIRNGKANEGGAVYLAAGTLRNCVLTGNRTFAAAFGLWGRGGGVYAKSNSLVEGCTISSNFAHYGGGAFIAGATLSHCTLFENDVVNGVSRDGIFGGMGGGVYCIETGRVEDCVLYMNYAQFYGGGVYGIDSVIQRSEFFTNRVALGASESPRVYPVGGGLYIFRSVAENCLIRGNKSHSGGGGAYLSLSRLQNSTVVSNLTYYSEVGSQADSAGVSLHSSTSRNCIIYGNVDGDQNVANCSTNHVGFEYTCTTPLLAGIGNFTNEPVFVNVVTGDYHLAAGSPCIDTGTTNTAPADDLDGNPRPLDGDNFGAANWDIGAFEYASAGADTDGDGQDDLTEVIAGSDALDVLSIFRIEGLSGDTNEDQNTLVWPCLSGRLYTVEKRIDFEAEWTPLDGFDSVNGYDGEMRCTNTTPSAIEYYRVRVSR